MADCIDRKQAITALWKALYDYEDATEKQFIESEDLDVSDWFLHRIFVQNMSDIDRQTILNLPSVQSNSEPKTNADKIRNMTDEEMAELWRERVDCGECPIMKDCDMSREVCVRLALEWLKREWA